MRLIEGSNIALFYSHPAFPTDRIALPLPVVQKHFICSKSWQVSIHEKASALLKSLGLISEKQTSWLLVLPSNGSFENDVVHEYQVQH